jgi:hypothetical protein
MKLILLISLSMLFVSCGNPHISSKEPPQKMISPIMPEDETGSCGEQTQEQQQQQQEDYDLLVDNDVLKLQKCKENEVSLEKSVDKLSWTFDRPHLAWGARMPFHSKALLQLLDCKGELLKEFYLNDDLERVGYSTLIEQVCRVTLTKI